MRSIPLEERDRWCQGLTENMGTGAGVGGRGLTSVERGMSLGVDSDAGSRDATVDEQCLRIANVADAAYPGLAEREEDDAGSREQMN